MPFYGPREAARLGQGDILRDVSFHIRHGQGHRVEVMQGIVTSHSCDCDKFHTWRAKNPGPSRTLDEWAISVAPIGKMNQVDAGLAGDIRRGRVPRYFSLPAEGFVLRHESLADLMYEQPVPAILLAPPERHVGTLSAASLRLFQAQLVELRTRRDLLAPQVEDEGHEA